MIPAINQGPELTARSVKPIECRKLVKKLVHPKSRPCYDNDIFKNKADSYVVRLPCKQVMEFINLTNLFPDKVTVSYITILENLPCLVKYIVLGVIRQFIMK